MSIVFRADDTGIADAAAWIASGRALAFPTETFYGLGCDPRHDDAVLRLAQLKRRPDDKGLPLLAGSLAEIDRLAPRWRDDPRAALLARAFWPGPLALVLEGAVALASRVPAPDGTVVARWSSHPVAAALARAVGFAIVATSANVAGEAPPRSADDVRRGLGESDALAILDGGDARGGLPSTIVDLRGGTLRIVREGATARAAILETLAQGEHGS